jgi:hypothetical protein
LAKRATQLQGQAQSDPSGFHSLQRLEGIGSNRSAFIGSQDVFSDKDRRIMIRFASGAQNG